MTRRVVYGVGLWAFLAATAMTIASIIKPEWISWYTTTEAGQPIHYTYGLHRRCSSLTSGCTHFPAYEDCHGEDRYFCSMWRTVGFLMSFVVVIELATLVAYAVILLGGRQKREAGWKMLAGLLGVCALGEGAGLGIIAFLFDHDERFFTGWRLDTSWILSTVSFSVLVLSAVGIVAAAYVLPSEGDYELIPGENQ